jgi:hypothetical protein
MTQPTFIKLTLLTLFSSFTLNEAKCQSAGEYVDRIKKYQAYVDSLVFSYSTNPASSVRHGIIHYNCIDSTGEDKGYGSGGSANIYFDPKSKTTFQITYIKGCSTPMVERTLYFVDNKIVLAIIADSDKNATIYFRSDKQFKFSNADVVTEKFANNILKDGYEIVKDFK